MSHHAHNWCWNEGKSARRCGKQDTACPYKPSGDELQPSSDRAAWMQGYYDTVYERVMEARTRREFAVAWFELNTARLADAS